MTILAPNPAAAPSALPSHTARWDDLCRLDTTHRGTASPAPRDGWEIRWGLDLHRADGVERVPAAEVRPRMFDDARPARRFTWRTGQQHRPGLQHMTSLGVQVGFESLPEQRLLVAVDFDGGARDVLSQPFRLRWLDGTKWRAHVPDYLLRTDRGVVIANIRPAGLVHDDDRGNFAACDALARLHGWRHEVVSSQVQPAASVVDTLSAQRRPMADRLGMRGQLTASLAGSGPIALGTLVDTTTCPAVARAFVVGMLWRKELTADLRAPLGDTTVVGTAP